jgi:hypothetical protein
MNVEIGSEAAQFPEKEYINVFFCSVYYRSITAAMALLIFAILFLNVHAL